MKTTLHLLMISMFSILAMSCSLDRHGLTRAPDPVSWNVAPPYFCLGDPVVVSWNFSTMGKAPANCRPPNGGFDSLTACSTSSSCPAGTTGSACLDDYCCRRDLFEQPGSLMCDDGRGCYPAFDITITAPPLTIEPPVDSESRFVRGSRTVMPTSTTNFRIEGGYASTPPYYFADRKTATLVYPSPPTPIPLVFPFACTGATPGWSPLDFNANPLATEHVRISGVRNAGGRTIVIQRSGFASVTLGPGTTTDRLNGRVEGVWNASLSPLDPAFLNRPRCGPTEIGNPWPDLPVLLMLVCSVE